MSTSTSIQDLAKEAGEFFTTKAREDGAEYFTLKDGAPEWVKDLIHKAHGEFLPDDYRYRWAYGAMEFIADSDGDPMDDAAEFADLAVDTYTGDRLAWLSSNLQRPGYCDQVVQDYGSMPDPGDIISLIGCGQYVEAEEVYGLVLQALESVSAEEGS